MIAALGRARVPVMLLFVAVLVGCDSPVVRSQPGAATPGRGGTPVDQAVSQAHDQTAVGSASHATHPSGDGGVEAPLPPMPVVDTDFSESDRTRDPFRSFAHDFIPVGPTAPVDEHVIKLRDYALEQLQLIAVILGTENPYAMLIDSTGRGTIIRRGDYVGRPDTVAGTEGMMPHQVPWRVARIVGSRVSRDADNNLAEVPGEVVFEREDRLNPNAARAERVITLTPGSQANRPADANATPSAPVPVLPGFGPGGTPWLPSLPTTGGSAAIGREGATFVQSYTQVVPPQPTQPNTVVIQTGPHGDMSVSGPGQTQGPGGGGTTFTPTQTPPANPVYPYMPTGGSGRQPSITVNDGPTNPDPPLPSSGLSH